MITFGPIPSRRLGSSLGVNHIPGKFCSYACVYCQAGPTRHLTRSRREFFHPEDVTAAIEAHLVDLEARKIHVDYLSFVPDGEPTLDIHLGEMLIRSRPFGLPVAVFTNSTLLSDLDVRQELFHADLVSVKVDSVDTAAWRKVDRPFHQLELSRILDGIRQFATEYPGRLITETMLVQGLNDSLPALAETAEFVAGLNPSASYLAVPTRPPMENWVVPPSPVFLAQALAVFRSAIATPVVLLSQGDQGKFAATSQVVKNILAITRVHPMRRTAVLELLLDAGECEADLDHLVERGLLQPVIYQGEQYYRRSPLLDHEQFPASG